MKNRQISNLENYFDENNIGIHIDIKGLFEYMKQQYWAPDYIKYGNMQDFSDTLADFIRNGFKLTVKSSNNKLNLSVNKKSP